MPDDFKIRVVDLGAQYRSIRGEIDAAIAGVLERGIFILGEEVERFEAEFAQACGTSHAVGVASGTDALRLALSACGIGPGDEVITVSHTAVATVAAIEQTGAKPVLVDIDPARYTLDPEKAASALSARTRAVVPVHLYGCPADLEPILEFARRRNLFVIEDCSQAHGALYRSRKVGTWSQIAAYSFYPTKNLGAYGDAGAIITDDPQLARQVKLLRQYGWEERSVSSLSGTNSRLDDLQAAVLRVKLGHLEKWNAKRRRLAGLYSTLLASTGLSLPIQPDDVTHVYHQYVIRHPRRDVLRQFLLERGIETGVHYPVPIHLQPAYQSLGLQAGDLPETERAAREVISLPIHPGLSEGDIERVARSLREFNYRLVGGRGRKAGEDARRKLTPR